MNSTDQDKFEQAQAERLEQYVAGLEKNNIFAVQGTLSDEDKQLLQFTRAFKVANQPVTLSARMTDRFSPDSPSPRKRWSWLWAASVAGGALAVGIWLFFQRPELTTAPGQVATNTLVNSTNTDQSNQVTNQSVALADVRQELAQIDQLDAELATAADELDAQIEEINFYAAEDGLENI